MTARRPPSRRCRVVFSSDIWRVDLGERRVCVKRALPRLKVAADWCAPVERNAYEAAWIETASGIVADAAPRLLGHDPEAGLIVMDYLDPQEFPLWKEKLRQGRADPADARNVASQHRRSSCRHRGPGRRRRTLFLG